MKACYFSIVLFVNASTYFHLIIIQLITNFSYFCLLVKMKWTLPNFILFTYFEFDPTE